MDYNGTWKVYFDDNLEGFLKAMSVPEMMIKMSKDVKPVTVIKQNGPDFTIEVKTPVRTNVNSFSLGKETEITAMDGRKFKCTVREEEGKLVFETDKFTSVREIQGEDMVEVGLILIHSMINGSMFCFLEVQLQYDEGIIN
ncbi:fatty acid-binding protein 10-A, liver basic-like isoform X1 [Gadus chalcogrammus]|uniref:fatty acid-binding protein 10-A, liver basic-like isoform X1 n=1 Tax=Gadus chalcogrammus TaxID=1042646 RepID=UPI0024C4BA6D|nr:fatty acid-binding protein 10-A, liver basic-like isoform X1 [Gadus chalcogrammus]